MLTTQMIRNSMARIMAVAASGLLIIPGVVHTQGSDPETTPVGEYYIAETFRDWNRLCLNDGSEQNPCHIYQLIEDVNGHPTAELAIFTIEKEEGLAAAANILTPLETLLTAGLQFKIDDGTRAEYPFSWCDKHGCHVRLALTDDDVFAMRKGSSASIIIESITAPGQPIVLEVSLLGFTAALSSLE